MNDDINRDQSFFVTHYLLTYLLTRNADSTLQTDRARRWLVDVVRQMTASSAPLLLVQGEVPSDLAAHSNNIDDHAVV